MSASTVPSNLFKWFCPQPQVVSSQASTGQCSLSSCMKVLCRSQHFCLCTSFFYSVLVLMAMVQSVIRRIPNSLCSTWRNPWQDTCKCSLLKVREGNCKREHGGPRWNLEAKRVFLFPRCF
jgi:hypothetical protein